MTISSRSMRAVRPVCKATLEASRAVSVSAVSAAMRSSPSSASACAPQFFNRPLPPGVYLGAFFKESAMRMFSRLSLALALIGAIVPSFAIRRAPDATAERTLPAPNYDLASRWTATKVGKYVFSTSVTPNWMEFSDRFWYSYETPAGQKWWMVDPVKRTKTPLWDNAKVAAQLTRILRTPYDAQHLPINQPRFFDNDTKIRFSVTLPRDSKVETADGKEIDGQTTNATGR